MMLRTVAALAVLAHVLGLAVGHSVTSEQADAYKPASPDVLSVVRFALRDRLIAGDIPDVRIAHEPGEVRLYVRADLPSSKLILTADALPEMSGLHFELITLREAQEIAERTGKQVRFVIVDRVHVDSDSAKLWLGGDFVAPAQPGIVKLCCCEGEALFLKRNGAWRFEKWSGAMRCS